MAHSEKILVVGGPHDLRVRLELALHGYKIEMGTNGLGAAEKLKEGNHALAIVAIHLGDISGLQIVDFLKNEQIPTEVILFGEEGEEGLLKRGLKTGAFDYWITPLTNWEKIVRSCQAALEARVANLTLHPHPLRQQNHSAFCGIVGKSLRMQEIFKTIRSVAKSSSSILITGQSGTGKELVARAIHECSERAKKPFLVINCAATPDGLMASELFGHVKGAFTGAITDRQGFFAAAHGGTIFIDEVGDMSLAMQVKILRVLQEGEIKPVGSTTNQLIDVRVIAATNHELVQLIRQNQFREDLYYRLNVIHIHLPMLRERTDDIPLLAYHFLGKFSRQLKKNVYHISVDALQTLQNYHWPGNIRELENIIERSIILAAGDTIQARILPAAILSRDFYHRTSRDEDLAQYPYQEAKRRALNIFNNSYIMDVLQKAKGNISAAAELAGMDRSNFKKIIKKYKIDPIRIE